MIEVRVNNNVIEYDSFLFSGGEVHVRLNNSWNMIYTDRVEIYAHLSSSEEVMKLALITDALRRKTEPGTKFYLTCPYVPYARQDRVMENGEALGIRVISDIINSLRFDRVTIYDPHSDVTSALLNNVEVVDQTSFVQFLPLDKGNTILVAPDAGAMKKTLKSAKGLGYGMVVAEKIRDTKDGSIVGTKVHSEHVGNKDFLIVDDICDGGRTFIELAKELKTLTSGNIYLYVTHGIFSRGLSVFGGLIDKVYTVVPFSPFGKNYLSGDGEPELVIIDMKGMADAIRARK